MPETPRPARLDDYRELPVTVVVRSPRGKTRTVTINLLARASDIRRLGGTTAVARVRGGDVDIIHLSIPNRKEDR